MKKYHYLILLFVLIIYCLNINFSTDNGLVLRVEVTKNFKTEIVNVQKKIFNVSMNFMDHIVRELGSAAK